MRHLWSVLAGIVAAPLAWLLLATGQHRSQRTVADWEQSGFFDTGQLIGPMVFLLVAGVLLGVLGTLRWSPAGPVAAGVLLLLPMIFMIVNPFRTLEFFSYGQPRRLFGQDLQPWLPIENGTLLVLGSLLLVAVASVQRWRRWPATTRPIPPATDEEVVAGVAALTQPSGGPSPMSDDEILAAAAALDEQTTGGDRPAPAVPAPPAGPTDRPEADAQPPREPAQAGEPAPSERAQAGEPAPSEQAEPATPTRPSGQTESAKPANQRKSATRRSKPTRRSADQPDEGAASTGRDAPEPRQRPGTGN